MKAELRVRHKREEKDHKMRRRGLWKELEPTERERNRTNIMYTPRNTRIARSSTLGSAILSIWGRSDRKE
jgi:hypothetical protein